MRYQGLEQEQENFSFWGRDWNGTEGTAFRKENLARRKLLGAAIAMAMCWAMPASASPAAFASSRGGQAPRGRQVCRAGLKMDQTLARDDLMGLIQNEERGLRTQQNANKRDEIVRAIDALGALGREQVTTDDGLSATWRMLWTTEKEQLFIIEKANLFGTQAGDILQVGLRSIHKRIALHTLHILGISYGVENSYQASISLVSSFLLQYPAPNFSYGSDKIDTKVYGLIVGTCNFTKQLWLLHRIGKKSHSVSPLVIANYSYCCSKVQNQSRSLDARDIRSQSEDSPSLQAIA